MSTIDQILTDEWTKIADSTESFMLSVYNDTAIAIAYTDTETDPTVMGHMMNVKNYDAQGYIRVSSIPPGYAYAKTLTPSYTATVGLTVWTE